MHFHLIKTIHTHLSMRIDETSIKFTKEGTITVTTEIEDNHVIVNVKDTGRGIDSEMLP